MITEPWKIMYERIWHNTSRRMRRSNIMIGSIRSAAKLFAALYPELVNEDVD